MLSCFYDFVYTYYQELYIRRMDGGTLDLKDEVEKVIKCLEAAILRRVSEVTTMLN